MQGPVQYDIQNFNVQFPVADIEKILNSIQHDRHVSFQNIYLNKN